MAKLSCFRKLPSLTPPPSAKWTNVLPAGGGGVKNADRFELRGEMAKDRRFIRDRKAAEHGAVVIDFGDCFGNIVDMALSINPARDGEPNKFHRRRHQAPGGIVLTEHDAADLDGPNSGMKIERTDDGLARVFFGRDVRHKAF